MIGERNMTRDAPRAGYTLFVERYGWDGLLDMLTNIMAPHLDLYAVSRDWHTHPGDIHMLKAKGAKGDLLIFFRD